MKKYLIYLLALLIFASCRKENIPIGPTGSPEQEWYEKQPDARAADWAQAERYPDYVLVPLHTKPQFGFRKLAILKDSAGYRARILEILPDLVYWQRRRHVNTADFTGRIFIYDHENNLLGGRTYRDGKQVGEIKPQASAPAGIKTNMAQVIESCAWYDRSYVDGDGVFTVYSERVCSYAVYDNTFYPDTGGGGGSTGGDPIGGGGGGGSSTAAPPPVADLPGENNPKIDPKRYMDCFGNLPDLGADYKVTVYVQEPVPGLPFNYGLGSVGHTAIGLTKTVNGQSITQVVGFYPDATGKDKIHAPSKLADNSGLDFTVSITYDIQGFEFRSIVNYLNNPPGTYDIYNFNCTTFVYNAVLAGNVKLPDPTTNMGMFQTGMTPAALGNGIRTIADLNDTNTSGGKVNRTHGPCN